MYSDEQKEEIKKAYFFLTELKKALELIRKKDSTVATDVVAEYKVFILNFNNFVPGVLNTFDEQIYLDFNPLGGSYFNETRYKIDGLLIRAIRDISAIKSIIDKNSKSPLIVKKDFSHITDNDLRRIIERDYEWITKCVAVEAWKPVIILAGGIIEALLLDELSKDQSEAQSSSKAPSEKDLRKWDLTHLIDVAVDISIINIGAEKLGEGVRQYRNLVHPRKELRAGLKIEPEEAKIAMELVNMIIRDLSNKK